MLKMFSKVFQCFRLDYIACTISNWSDGVRKLNGHQHRCTVASPNKKTRLCFNKLLGFALIEKEVASAVPSVENLQDIQVHIFKTLSFLVLSISSQHQKFFLLLLRASGHETTMTTTTTSTTKQLILDARHEVLHSYERWRRKENAHC